MNGTQVKPNPARIPIPFDVPPEDERIEVVLLGTGIVMVGDRVTVLSPLGYSLLEAVMLAAILPDDAPPVVFTIAGHGLTLNRHFYNVRIGGTEDVRRFAEIGAKEAAA